MIAWKKGRQYQTQSGDQIPILMHLLCWNGVRHPWLLWRFKDDLLDLLLCCEGESFMTHWLGPQKTKKSGCQAVQHQTHPSISGPLPWRNWGWSLGLMGGCFLFSFPATGAWDPYQKNCSRSCWTHSYLPAVTVSSPYHDIMCLDWDGDIVVKSIMIQLQDCCSPFMMAFTWTGVN